MSDNTGNYRIRRAKRGVSLVEVAMGLGVMSLVALGVVQITNDQNQASRALGAATQLETVRASANDWMRANYQQLVANLPVGGGPVLIPVARTIGGGPVPGPVTIGAATLPSLQGGGFIPATTIDRNPYGHSHTVMVRQSAPGTLEALVVQTGGQPIRDGDLGRIVTRMGHAGGARFMNNANPAMANVVQGGGGAWQADTAVWNASGVTPQVSRAAAVVNFGNASMLSDFLNRYDIGVPEANTMRTAINLGNNDINNAATVRANQAILQNGGMACASNAMGCSFWISDDGRFSDFNDGWVRFQSQSAGAGFSVEGPAGGGNLWVQGQGTFVGDLSTQGSLWTLQGARLGRDMAGNPTGGGFLDVAGNAWVSGNTQTGTLSVVGNSWVGGNATVVGTLGANQVWATYVNSSGSVDTRTLNVGQSATIWGPGGLTVVANATIGGDITAGGNITTPGTLNAGYIRSTGSVDAGMDLNAARHVNAQARVTGMAGIRTQAQRVPMSACDFANESGMIAISTIDGSLLQCTTAGRWSNVIPASVGAMDVWAWTPPGAATNYMVSVRCRDPGFFISFGNPASDAAMAATPGAQSLIEALPNSQWYSNINSLNINHALQAQCVSSGSHTGRTQYDYFTLNFY